MIGITVPLLHLLYNETENVTQARLGKRRYSPDAYFILAAISVLCHEYAHVALGHLDGSKPPKSIIRVDEFSADDHGGRLTSRQFALQRPALRHHCGIETVHEFVEAAIIGQASLFTVLQVLHQPSETYHGPTLRVRHMYAGFIKGTILKRLLVREQLEERFGAARSLLQTIAGDFAHADHLAAVLSTCTPDEKLFERVTAIDVAHRVAETMNQSRFLAPLRDRIGGFKGPRERTDIVHKGMQRAAGELSRRG
ncbi:hypothetical protein [Sinorhizobium americanum]|uniref:hypothetical protein n=1 Tax=Sinorhizobium americanum TaxID=194963 RepID=UPI0012EBCB7C|nr:hypothetical protein [Sinorhizobium americanum]